MSERAASVAPPAAPDAAVTAAFHAALLEDDPEELYENAPCAYLSTRPDGTILKVNATFLAWTGYRREELMGRRFQELLAPGDRIFYETHWAPLLQMQGQAREIAVEIVSGSGARLAVLANAGVRTDAAGDPRVVRIVLFDATERRAYERELLAARRRAEESEARATALARTLQASLLPPALISIPGLDLGGAYRPAGEGSEVGGDFYDVFETGRGTWGVVIGDVCGKGPAAAVLTALARYTVRAVAHRTASPSAVLGVLHETLARDHPEQFCTALLLDLEPTGEGAQLTVTSGGHHLPLRLSGAGAFDALGEPGSILGMLDGPRLHERAARLGPGEVVALYTDGVIEGRRGREFFGERRLKEAILASASLDARSIAERIVADALAFQEGYARDDMAVVVIKAG